MGIPRFCIKSCKFCYRYLVRRWNEFTFKLGKGECTCSMYKSIGMSRYINIRGNMNDLSVET